MDILKTIPAIPEKPNVIHKVKGLTINFSDKIVSFEISDGINAVTYSSVSFAAVSASVTAPQKNTFILIVRTALALAMGVDISKIPLDIFA